MWKEKLLEIVKDFKHTAWGFSHFTRIFELSLELAKAEQFEIDSDALYAAAYLHDIGAFEPYSQKGKDHSDVAIENCDKILKSINFPVDKNQLVSLNISRLGGQYKERLASDIFKLTNLQDLSLIGAFLAAHFKHIGNLRNLKRLYIYDTTQKLLPTRT